MNEPLDQNAGTPDGVVDEGGIDGRYRRRISQQAVFQGCSKVDRMSSHDHGRLTFRTLRIPTLKNL